MNELLPTNNQAEAAILGSILIYPPAYHDAAKFINTNDLYNDRHKWIYNVFEKLMREHINIDILTVSSELESQSKLQSVGGFPYLTELVNNTPSAMNCEYYAKIVAEMAVRRRMIQSASDMVKTAFDTSADIETYIPTYISEVLKNISSENDTKHISSGLSKLYDDIAEKTKNPQEIYGIEMGLPKVDKITGGLQKGELFILSGEPGLGKSLLAVQIALHMGKRERPGIIYEMEMSDLQMLRRSLSSEAGVPVRSMKTGYVNDNRWNEITEAIQRMESLPVYLSDSTSWTTAKLRADLTRMKTLHGIEWFVVDYLRLLKDRFDGKEPERIGHIASTLHDICKDLGLAGLAIQSMTKEGMKGAGGMTGLYGGSEQHYSADIIAVMEKAMSNGTPMTDNNGREIINLKFEKNREGDTDKNLVQIIMKHGFPVFAEYERLPY